MTEQEYRQQIIQAIKRANHPKLDILTIIRGLYAERYDVRVAIVVDYYVARDLGELYDSFDTPNAPTHQIVNLMGKIQYEYSKAGVKVDNMEALCLHFMNLIELTAVSKIPNYTPVKR